MTLKDNYEEIINKELSKTQLYFLAIRSNRYKEFFYLIKDFILKIEKEEISAGSRGSTSNDGYFTTICKFFFSLFGADESECD